MPYKGYEVCECGENIPVGYGYYFFEKMYVCPKCKKQQQKETKEVQKNE